MVLVAGAVCRVPAAHCPAGTHCAAFCVLEYVPLWHGVHTRSADAVPAAETYVLGWHVVHGVHDGALVAVLN